MTGILILNKPKGITSFSACRKASRILGVSKAGHTGTLDPMATGVLVCMLSHCTRFSELLPEHKKSYRARVRLGITTDTLDITGTVLSKCTPNVTLDELLNCAEKFKGKIMQTPPMYSALKKDGKKLYELARQGVEVDRKEREIYIERLDISDFDGVDFNMEVTCSAGTYIRSLCDDLGKVLGCGACLTELCRTEANGFSIENAVTLEELTELAKNHGECDVIIPVDKALEEYPCITVSEKQSIRFKNGGELNLDRLKSLKGEGIFRVYSPDNEFLGLGQTDETKNALTVKRVFVKDE